jgi:hypothetical protein
MKRDPLSIEHEIAGIVSTLRHRKGNEQEPVEIPLERAESFLRRFWPAGVFLGIGAASYALPSIDFDLGLPIHSRSDVWWTLGGVVAVLTLIGFTSVYGFWKVTAWVVGIPIGLCLALLGLLIILSPQTWSSLHETFNAPLTLGGGIVIAIIVLSGLSRL